MYKNLQQKVLWPTHIICLSTRNAVQLGVITHWISFAWRSYHWSCKTIKCQLQKIEKYSKRTERAQKYSDESELSLSSEYAVVVWCCCCCWCCWCRCCWCCLSYCCCWCCCLSCCWLVCWSFCCYCCCRKWTRRRTCSWWRLHSLWEASLY